MLSQENLNWLFKKHYMFSVLAFMIVGAIFSVLLFRANISNPLVLLCIWLVLGLLFLEGMSRLLLRLNLGANYFYWLYSYCLVDNDLYGFRFRSSVASKEVEFPIFDRVAFPAGVQPSINMTKNVSQRLRFETNSMGFRGKEFDPKIKPRKFRMFCVGGSTTACGMCAENETWPHRLQVYLDENNCDIEVINAGTLGWTSYQEFLLVKEELIHYKPDIVLLHQGWNEEFVYSSLDLGKSWSPGITRNVRESYNLYTTHNPLLSSTASVAFSLIIQHIYKNILFARNMSFQNRGRWDMLRKPEYMQAWFDNMVSIARLAKENNFLAIALNYPGLTNIADLPQHREEYVQNTRLTHPYADYQAISKKRISNTLKLAEPIFPCLGVDVEFEDIVGKERLDLFLDEIHLSPAGNDLFASSVSKLLQQEPRFRDLCLNGKADPYEIPAEETIQNIRKSVGANPNYLERIIDRNYYAAKPAVGGFGSLFKSHSTYDIPQTRYTTW